MARKSHMLRTLSVLLLLVVAGASGCASGGKTKPAVAALSNVAPISLPPASVAEDSRRLSGVDTSRVTTPVPSPTSASAYAIDDVKPASSPRRDSYSSRSSSGGSCSTGGCSRCGN